MHPAISVIFFTVLSGAGFGLIALAGLGWPFEAGAVRAFAVCLLAGGMSVVGLVSSTFHLGHPERALLAFSQWRSSWLSREGVLAVATLVAFGLYGLNWVFFDSRIGWLGAIVAGLALLTVIATAMIYAQLRTVPSWNHWLTPCVYVAFSLASGGMAALALGQEFALAGLPNALMAIIALTAAWAIKVAWWNRVAGDDLKARGHTVESATGLGGIGGGARVRLLERPHSGENYLTREMVHQIGRKHARKLRFIAMTLGGLLPLLLAGAALLAQWPALALLGAFGLMMAGLLVERWLFFAEARHAVSLYYD